MTGKTLSHSPLLIEGGRSLIDRDFAETCISIENGVIAGLDEDARDASIRIDADGLLVLPGIVDLHGDAFERQMMPRPGVDFPIDLALIESDRQLIANGITTAFHAVTWSWEPGLRGAENAHVLVNAVETLRPQLAADTRIHLRHETYNLDAEDTIADWIASRRIGLLAFNDHLAQAMPDAAKPQKRAQMAERTGLSIEQFNDLVQRVAGRANDVPASVARLAARSVAAGIPALSHDDETPQQRRTFRESGIRIAEFPVNEATAREAIDAGEHTVFGAPNVVRGGSHTGWIGATDMVRKGLCTILASDYYYPAMMIAAFQLAAENVLPLAKAWALISAAPAAAASLHDRGTITSGLRADLILVDASQALRPRIVAVIASGRLVHLTEAHRISRNAARARTVVAA